MAEVHEAVLYLLHTPAKQLHPCLAVTCSLQFLELGSKTKGPSKENQDPTKPKGVRSAFNIFNVQNMKRIRDENKGIDDAVSEF